MSNHEIGDSGFYDTNRRDFVNSMEEPVRESLAVHAAIVADHTPIVPELDQPIPIVNPADYFESNNQIGLSVVVKTVDPQSMRKDRDMVPIY